MHHAVRKAYYQAGRVYQMHMDVLYQCDLDCEHCYLDDKSRRLLGTDQWRDIIDQAAELGVFELHLSGGELFLRRDALDLIAHARGRGLIVHLKSHGGSIDDDLADAIADLGVSTISISYYATDPEVHDAITRRTGSHARTLAAMKRLTERGVIVVASVVVMKRNKHEYERVVEQCAELGITVSLAGRIKTAQSGARFPLATALEAEDLIEFEAFQVRAEGHCNMPSPSGDWGSQKNCVAGTLALYVSPEGDVTPCVSWPEPLGNLARGDRLADIVTGSPRLARIRAHERAERKMCARCPVRESCDYYCMGQAWVETGSEHTGVREFCEMTRARTVAQARAEGRPDPPLPAGLETPAPPVFPILTSLPESTTGAG